MNSMHDPMPTRLMDGDREAIRIVAHWIAIETASPRFNALWRDREDLNQEAMSRLVASMRARRYDPERGFEAYVRGIARMTALQALTKRRRRREVPPSDRDEDWGPVERPDVVGRMHAGQMLERAMAVLSPRERALVIRYFIDEMTFAEIARECGVPEGTIKSRLFRALAKAHRRLTARPARARTFAQRPGIGSTEPTTRSR